MSKTKSVRSLDAMARKEIVDYVTGLGLAILDKEVKAKPKKGLVKRFNLHNFGWNKRLKDGMESFLQTATKEDLKAIGLRNNSVLENKDTIIKRCINAGLWDSVDGVKAQTWLKLAEHVRELQSSNIDTVVTTDIHRLIE